MIKAAIVGGSGYTGGELARIICRHPEIEVSAVTSRQLAGSSISKAHPFLQGFLDIKFQERLTRRPRRGLHRDTARGLHGDRARAIGQRRQGHRSLWRLSPQGPCHLQALVWARPQGHRQPGEGGLRHTGAVPGGDRQGRFRFQPRVLPHLLHPIPRAHVRQRTGRRSPGHRCQEQHLRGRGGADQGHPPSHLWGEHNALQGGHSPAHPGDPDVPWKVSTGASWTSYSLLISCPW